MRKGKPYHRRGEKRYSGKSDPIGERPKRRVQRFRFKVQGHKTQSPLDTEHPSFYSIFSTNQLFPDYWPLSPLSLLTATTKKTAHQIKLDERFY